MKCPAAPVHSASLRSDMALRGNFEQNYLGSTKHEHISHGSLRYHQLVLDLQLTVHRQATRRGDARGHFARIRVALRRTRLRMRAPLFGQTGSATSGHEMSGARNPNDPSDIARCWYKWAVNTPSEGCIVSGSGKATNHIVRGSPSVLQAVLILARVRVVCEIR